MAAVLTMGCASVPRQAGFDDVQTTVDERTGLRIHWNQGTSADASVADEVREMLARGELSADEAVQIALLNNRALQATYEDLMVAQADLVAAGLLENPIFEAEVTFAEGGGGTGLEFTVVQEFLGIFQIPLRKRIATARFEAAKLQVSGAVLDLASDVRDAHLHYVASRQITQMRRTIVQATEASQALAQRLQEAGNITILAKDMQSAQHEQAKLDLAAAEYEELARRERLNVVMGLWGQEASAWSAPDRLPDVPPQVLTGEPAETRALEEEAVQSSLELGQNRQDIERQARVLGLNRTYGLLPEAELGAKAERETDGEWAAGPVLELPIPLFNQGQPAVAAAAAELRRAQARHQATETQLRSAVRSAAALAQNARQRARTYQETVLPLQARIVEQTQLEYNAMVIGAFELLQARQQQIESGRLYIQALRDYWLARNALDTLLAGRMRGVAPAVAGGAALTPRGAEAGH